MLDKLKSRKFLATLITNIISVATLFVNYDNVAVQIISLIVLGLANIVYGIIEGTIDAKAIANQVKDTAEDVAEKL